jgi:hypothetical protein
MRTLGANIGVLEMGSRKENDDFIENVYNYFHYISVDYGGHPLNKTEYMVSSG